MASRPKLNVRQQRFVDGIIAKKSRVQALQDAGYTATGHSAEVCASDLLKKPEIAAEIARRQARVSERVEINAATVLSEYLSIATADIGEAYDESGDLLPLSEIPVNVRKAMSSYDIEHGMFGTNRKARFHSKVQALDALGKHLRMFGADQPAQQTNVFVLVAPPQAASPEQWAKDVQVQAAHTIASPQPPSAA